MAQNVVIKNSMKTPIFDGVGRNSAKIHWLLFEDYLTETEVDDALKIAKFRITLSGDPREWYEDNKASFTSIAILKTLFLNEYSPEESRAEYLRQLQTIKMGDKENLLDYKKRVFRTAVKAKLKDDADLITTQFVAGLPDSIRNHVRSRRDESLDDAYKTAQAVMVEKPTVVTPDSLLVAQRDRKYDLLSTGSDIDALADRVHKLMYVGDRGRQTSNSRSRPYDGGRYRSQSRSASRSHSRGRHDRRGRDQTPRRGRDQTPRRDRNTSKGSKDRRVSFRGKSRSPSPGPCYYCGQHGHLADSCHLLKKHLREGRVTVQKDQNF